MQKSMTGLKTNDLIYQFDFLDGVIVQKMLIALQHGYELKSISSAKGCVQFVLEFKGLNDANA